jgi:hypothetical protein
MKILLKIKLTEDVLFGTVIKVEEFAGSSRIFFP